MRHRSRRGTALVEFAATALLLLTLLFAFLEIGRLMLVYCAIADACRTGARYAMVNSSAAAGAVETRVRDTAKVALVDPAKFDVVVTMDSFVGGQVNVTATYDYEPMLALFPFDLTLATSSQGVVVH